jgi:hypothetical protein
MNNGALKRWIAVSGTSFVIAFGVSYSLEPSAIQKSIALTSIAAALICGLLSYLFCGEVLYRKLSPALSLSKKRIICILAAFPFTMGAAALIVRYVIGPLLRL